MARDEAVRDLVDKLELPFNSLGVDPYGVSKKHLTIFFRMLGFLYNRYFRVKAVGLENVPNRGRAMLVGNHSGGYAIDGAMVLTSMLLEKNPPRLAQGMVEKFMNQLAVSSIWMARTGQLTGLPEHAERLLLDDRLLMVFPEGAKGTAKLFKERHSLVDFGTGFVRLALKTKTPIVPFGFAGGGEAVPTVMNSRTLGKLLGVPYVPITPYGVAAPLPVKMAVHYGKPMVFEGTGGEEDSVIKGYVDQVKTQIAALIESAAADRSGNEAKS
ncbi:MAG: 1-acyl-sn-glycerol-3-phosphate acyltransferase [Archangium sp.]|nr:1-acyl-sn-glycerol-3-phosphate acyltransferase [Archangium sp.]